MIHFNESIYTYGGQWLSVDEPLHAGRTEFQDMLLFRNHRLGVVLVLDGVVQLTERDEFAYSEAMAHVPLFAHPRPARVLIVGGGDLCVLEEVLRHPEVERVTLVDLDAAVVEACKTHFAAAHRDAWRDPRVRLLVGDGAAHVRTTADRHDIILIDGPDPIVPGVDGCPLYTPAFFADCRSALAPGGLLATQCDVPFHHPESLRRTVAAMRGSFPAVAPFVAAVPCFHGGFAAFLLASPDPDATLGGPVRAPAPDLADALAYYTPELHRAAFAVPPYVRAALRGPLEPDSDLSQATCLKRPVPNDLSDQGPKARRAQEPRMDTPITAAAPTRAERQILFALAHRGDLGWGALLDAQDASIPEFVAALQTLAARGRVAVSRGHVRLTAPASAPAPLTCVCDACDGRGYAAPPDLPALAELRAALAGRPGPDFAFDQGAIPPEESLLRAASMQDRGDLWGQEVLFVGDFDLTSVALALTRQPARVVVLDIDPRVVAFVDAAGARLGLPLSGRLFDVRDPLPDDLRRRFDAFVCDPVETLPGIRLYLARGAAALRGEGSAAWIGLTTLEASRRKWYAIQQILASSGLVVTDLRRRFSGYPDHDDALALPGLEWPILRELGPDGARHRWYTAAWLRAEAIRTPEPAVDGRVDLGHELYVDDEAWATPRPQEPAR